MSTSPTRSIRTSIPQTTCDVCGRTLLRGERAEIYLSGGDRHSVCELCTSRALHGGWVREGTLPDYGPSGDRADRRRSLLRRRRGRRAGETAAPLEPPPFGDGPPMFDDEPLLGADDDFPAPAGLDPLDPGESAERPSAPDWPEPPTPRAPRRGRRRRTGPFTRDDADAGPEAEEARPSRPVRSAREPRHVHAVPTSVEHKIEAAIELFNDSEHPRTLAGITRSLGLPDVSVHPASPVAAMVTFVVAWELCWYRYEVDLSEEVPAVRGAGQGYELSELSELDRRANVSADERGRLSPRG